MSAPPSKQLGETEDPKQLIPGNVEKIQANVTTLSTESTAISNRLTSFKKVRTVGWSGVASDAWETNLDDEATKWTSYITLLDTAHTAMDTYAGALSLAQGKAADAIAKWKQGNQETTTALTAHNEQVDAYNAYNSVCRVPQLDPAGRVIPSIGPGDPGAFVDPGEATRDQAQTILDDARTALDDAGQRALKELGNLEGAKKEGSSDWFGADGSAKGPSFKWDAWDKAFGKDPSDGTDGKYSDEHDNDFNISLGQVDGSLWLYKADGSIEDYWGDVKVHADGSVTVGGLDGSAEASVSKEGLRIGADGTLTLIGAEGEVGGEWGYAEGTLQGEALVGATGEGHLVLDKTGAHAGGELFAGGRLKATASGDLGGVGGEAGVEGWAGAGLAGDVDVGYKDGKLRLHGSGGVALGLGGKLDAGITLDFPKMYETGSDIVENITSWIP